MKQCLLVVYLFFSCWLNAQDTTEQINYQVVLATDNDYFVTFDRTDRYYTYGLHTHFDWRSTKSPLLFKKADQWSHTLSFDLKAFTPDEEKLNANAETTRPFAGWSYFTYNQSYVFKQNTVGLGLQTGVIGPASGAAGLQNWFHTKVRDLSRVDGWDNQIQNFIGVNFIGRYQRSVLNKKYWQLNTDTKASFGNVNIFIEPSAAFLVGIINDPNKSMSTYNSILGNKKDVEVFLKFNAGIRLMAYDATLQGDLFQNKKPLDFSTVNHFSYFVAPSLQAMYHNFFGLFELRYMRGEIKTINNHHYGRICFGYRF